MSFHAPQEYLFTHPQLGRGSGNNGFFIFARDGVEIRCMASDGGGWEHVSVSLNKNRTPSWGQMCMVKKLFWDAEDVVMQLHPAESDYVNNHNYCLHLWRPVGIPIPTPPPIFVGHKSKGVIVR